MTNTYFDIETGGFNPETDKLLTVQFQQIDSKGFPVGDLNILKEWEEGEKAIVQKIHHFLIISGEGWGIIPIGHNLIFDLTFLWAKFKQYSLQVEPLSEYIYKKPMIDIKHMLVMMNGLNFKGAGLDKMTNKKTDGRVVPEYYRNREYGKITDYIIQETESFLEFFQKCLKKLPSINME